MKQKRAIAIWKAVPIWIVTEKRVNAFVEQAILVLDAMNVRTATTAIECVICASVAKARPKMYAIKQRANAFVRRITSAKNVTNALQAFTTFLIVCVSFLIL